MTRAFSQYLEEITACGGGTCSGNIAPFARPMNGGFVFHRNYPDTISTGDTNDFFVRKKRKRSIKKQSY